MKRASQAALAVCILLAGAALWARQQSPPASPATAKLEHRVEASLRNLYALSPAIQVKAEAPTSSVIPGIYKVPVVISYKGRPGSEHADVYVTHDGRYMIRGHIFDLLIDPFKKAKETLDAALKGHPYVGPAKACVNVVEFSDYECPHCREAHEVMKELEKHYPQVRFTFMDFPLTQIHPWALNAALAARCAFQENAADYPKMRDKIFANQAKITPDNASSTLVSLGTEAGLNANTLQACMASPATHKEVESDLALGKAVIVPGTDPPHGVNSTPTIFVNGRPVVGGEGQLINQMITYELAKCKGGPTSK